MKWLLLFLMSAAMQEVACQGDSLTEGFGLSNPLTQSYPAQLLAVNFMRRVENLGVPGSVVSQMIDWGPVDVDDRWLSQFSKHIVVIWAGTNDLYGGADGNTVATTLLQASQDRRTAGALAIVMSSLPRTSAGQSAGFETQRQVMRTNLTANWAASADAYVDIGGDPTIGIQGSQNNPVYYQSDLTHGTAALYAIVVHYIVAAIQTISP